MSGPRGGGGLAERSEVGLGLLAVAEEVMGLEDVSGGVSKRGLDIAVHDANTEKSRQSRHPVEIPSRYR